MTDQASDPQEPGVAYEPLTESDDGCAPFPRTISGFDMPEGVYWDRGSDSWYVSNMGGSPIGKDGVGWISKLDRCGDVVEAQWVSGLDAPKGIRVRDGKLYTCDLDQLVIVDMATRAVTKIPAPGAFLLNDPAIDNDGTVYAADTFLNTVWRFKDGVGEIFVSSPVLDFPNGMIIEGNTAVIASTGTLAPPITQGKVWHLDLRTRALTQYGSFEEKMDGVEKYEGGYLISANMTSKVYHVTKNSSSLVHDFSEDGATGINDIALDRERNLFAVPAYLQNELILYPLGDE